MGLAYFHVGTTTKHHMIVLYFEERPISKKEHSTKKNPTTIRNVVEEVLY